MRPIAVIKWLPPDKHIRELDSIERTCGNRLSRITQEKHYLGLDWFGDGTSSRCMKYATTKGLQDLGLSKDSYHSLFKKAKMYEDETHSDLELIEQAKAAGLVADIFLSCRLFDQLKLVSYNGTFSKTIQDSEGHRLRLNPNMVFGLRNAAGKRLPFVVFLQRRLDALQRQVYGVLEGFLQGALDLKGYDAPQILFLLPESEHLPWREILSESIGNKRRQLLGRASAYDPERIEFIARASFDEKWLVASEEEIGLGFYKGREVLPGALGDVWHDINGYHGITPFPEDFEVSQA